MVPRNLFIYDNFVISNKMPSFGSGFLGGFGY